MRIIGSLLILVLVVLALCFPEYDAGAAVGEPGVHYRGAPGVHHAHHQEVSSFSNSGLQVYRVVLVITSQSDWTTCQVSGGHIISVVYEVTEGDQPDLECWFDAHLSLVGMAKEQYDASYVSVQVTAIIYVKDSDLSFTIQKGDIEYTTVEIYNYNGDKPVFIEAVTNDLVIAGDPENPVEFSIDAADVKRGGPISLLVYPVPTLVWAFYYPWYYRNQWFTSEVLTDSPLKGPHSSADPNIIDMHIRQAQSAGIDGFIVSWWGENDYTDQNLKVILDIAQKHDFKITIYFESLGGEGPRSERELQEMFLSFFQNYGNDERYYRIDGEPVIFVWAVDSHPPSVWESVLEAVRREGYSAVYIAETGQPDYLDVFDGLHLYGTVGRDDLSMLYERLSLVCRTYGYLYDTKMCLWAATLCPGYDDRNIPGRAGLYQPREDGRYYRETFEAAINSSPDWLLITSFNEWWENTHIEPSVNYGTTYLEMTSRFSSTFKGVEVGYPEQKDEKENEKEVEEHEKEPEIVKEEYESSEQKEASTGFFLLVTGFIAVFCAKRMQHCRRLKER
jgi:hypothetical protein